MKRSKIEWTDAARPWYNAHYGTNTGRRNQDCLEEVRDNRSRLRASDGNGAEMVQHVQEMADGRRVREGFVEMGWTCGRLQERAEHKGSICLHSQDSASTWQIVRSAARRRREAGKAARELLRGDGAPASPKYPPVCRLWAPVASEGTAA